MDEQKKVNFLAGLIFTSYLLTVLFTLLSGLGTYCAAFKTEQFPRMAALLPYQILYQGFMISSTSIGLWGTWDIVSYFRNKTDMYRNAYFILILGLMTGAIQMISSEIIRGTSTPVNFRVYVTLITLIIFVFFRHRPAGTLIGLVESDRKTSPGQPAMGSALIMGGILTLTTQFWVGDSHIARSGYNWVNDLEGYLLVAGVGLILLGAGVIVVWLKHQLRITFRTTKTREIT